MHIFRYIHIYFVVYVFWEQASTGMVILAKTPSHSSGFSLKTFILGHFMLSVLE